jgi:hypothetical protein
MFSRAMESALRLYCGTGSNGSTVTGEDRKGAIESVGNGDTLFSFTT